MHNIRNFHGYSTVGEWQGSGRVVVGSRQGNVRATAWERHGMFESAFKTAGERHGMCESAFKTARERHENSMGTAWYV
jgi:hypothetical protein